jgi:hypothetical protein
VSDLDSEGDFVPVLISADFLQATPDSLYFLETTPDLGRSDLWRVVSAVTTDSRGVASLPAMAMPMNSNQPNLFFRLRRL